MCWPYNVRIGIVLVVTTAAAAAVVVVGIEIVVNAAILFSNCLLLTVGPEFWHKNVMGMTKNKNSNFEIRARLNTMTFVCAFHLSILHIEHKYILLTRRFFVRNTT